MIPNYISHTIKGREEVRDARRPMTQLPDEFFRVLDPTEEAQFRQWARDNFDPTQAADPCWHPIVRKEWGKLKEESNG